MNQLVQLDETEDDPIRTTEDKPAWQLKKLKPVHRQICALIAQGFKNTEVAAMTGVTKEYITMLLRQTLIKEHIAQVCEVVGVRMEILFEKSVDVISEAMTNGNHTEKLKAARLQLEATKRIGRPDPGAGLTPGDTDRLERLAERMLALQSQVRVGRIFNESGQEIQDAEFSIPASGSRSYQPTQAYGDGKAIAGASNEEPGQQE